MKKLIICMAGLMCALAINVCAAKEVTTVIPDYQCIMGNSSVYYQDSIYPLISYRDVTYFPMTYEYCRALDLSTSWVEGKGLYIVYQPSVGNALPVYDTTVNAKHNTAVIPEYPIYINGKLVEDNEDREYPFLNFRGVTYCPMTWDLARNEFAWITDWQEGVFTIKTGLRADRYYNFVRALPDGLVFNYGVDKEVPNEDGSVGLKSEIFYEKYDFATGSMQAIEYDEKAEENQFKYTEAAVEIRDDKCYFRDAELSEIKILTEENSERELLRVTNTVRGYGYTLSGVQFYDFDYNCHADYADVTSIGRETHSYLELDGKLIYIGKDEWISKAAKAADGNIYFHTQMQLKMIRTHTSILYRLYRVTPDGSITCVNSEFPDYNSMEILGDIDGKMYLRCTYSPAETPMLRDYYEVSAVNDGYFTYAGVGSALEKVCNYVYADESYVSPAGDIYGLIRWRGEVRKLN